MRDLYGTIAAQGIAIAVVVAQSGAAVGRFLEHEPLPFPVLLDPDRSIIKAYGVYHPIGIDAFRMARPAFFFVDARGIIRFLHVSSSQFERLPAEQILAEAGRLGQGGRA